MKMSLHKILVMLVCLFTMPLGYSHGMIHEQIHDLTKQINKHPDNTALLMKRGRLYIEDEKYTAAKNDFMRILKLDSQNRSTHYYLSDVALKQHQYKKAIHHATQFISMLQDEAGALSRGYRLLGAAYEGQKNHSQAAIAYQEVLKVSEQPHPEYYLDLANVLHKAQQHQQAINVLDDGLSRLGTLIVLQDKALHIEIDAEKHSNALQRIDHMIEQGQRLHVLYQQKGGILQTANRHDEAVQAYKMAVNEIDKLPIKRRNTQAMQAQYDHLMEAISQCANPSDTHKKLNQITP